MAGHPQRSFAVHHAPLLRTPCTWGEVKVWDGEWSGTAPHSTPSSFPAAQSHPSMTQANLFWGSSIPPLRASEPHYLLCLMMVVNAQYLLQALAHKGHNISKHKTMRGSQVLAHDILPEVKALFLKKINIVISFPLRKTKRQLWGFLRIVSCHQNGLPDFSARASSLYIVTKEMPLTPITGFHACISQPQILSMLFSHSWSPQLLIPLPFCIHERGRYTSGVLSQNTLSSSKPQLLQNYKEYNLGFTFHN